MKLLIPPVLFALCLTAMILLRLFYPANLFFPKPYHLLGLFPIALGLLSSFLGIRQFLKAKTNIHPFHEADTLVTDGPYRFTRNPIYLGFLLMVIGFPLNSGVFWGVVLAPFYMLTMSRLVIEREEVYLERKFKNQYTSYTSRVRRWL